MMVSQKEIIEAFEQALNWANTQESDGYAEHWLDRKSGVAVNWSLIRRTIRRLATEGIAPPDGLVLVPIDTLSWWVELAEINPKDLRPRIQAMLAAAPKGVVNEQE